MSVSVEPTTYEDFGVVMTDISTPAVEAPFTGLVPYMGIFSSFWPGETSEIRDPTHNEAFDAPIYDLMTLDMIAASDLPPFEGARASVETSDPVYEGADYSSEILHRHPSYADLRNEHIHDDNVNFVRELISRLNPSSLVSLDRFTKDANVVLYFLAHFGLDEQELQY